MEWPTIHPNAVGLFMRAKIPESTGNAAASQDTARTSSGVPIMP